MNLITPSSEFCDAMEAALDQARRLRPDRLGLVGYGVAHLLDGEGKTKLLVPFANVITDAGDQYYAKKGGGISTTAANGMKLGTSSTAPNKTAGTNVAIGTYITGSNLAFDATYPQAAAVGTNVGWNLTYKTTWAAGTATNSTINEVAIVNDQTNNTDGSTAGNTYSRAVISTVNKTASDSLAITWNHKFLGA